MKWTDNGATVLETDADWEEAYLDWCNNFISVARFAEHCGWSEETARNFIDEWRYENRVRELEAEGCTRSDAQAVADAELLRETT